jgi:hypothetical protein
MEAQEVTDLIEKLIEQIIARKHVRTNAPERLPESDREVAETKARLTDLLRPLFT